MTSRTPGWWSPCCLRILQSGGQNNILPWKTAGLGHTGDTTPCDSSVVAQLQQSLGSSLGEKTRCIVFAELWMADMNPDASFGTALRPLYKKSSWHLHFQCTFFFSCNSYPTSVNFMPNKVCRHKAVRISPFAKQQVGFALLCSLQDPVLKKNNNDNKKGLKIWKCRWVANLKGHPDTEGL